MADGVVVLFVAAVLLLSNDEAEGDEDVEEDEEGAKLALRNVDFLRISSQLDEEPDDEVRQFTKPAARRRLLLPLEVLTSDSLE